LRTVKYSVSDDVKFEKIAQKLGRSKRLVLSQMIDYFYRSKKDPTDLNDDLLKNAILKGQKEYIGFIRAQETELLIPIKRDTSAMLEILKRIVNSFNTQILQHNQEVLANQLAHSRGISSMNEAIKYIERKLQTKVLLKSKFESILNSYIKERDRLGLMSSAKDKEVLAEDARKQIEFL